MWFNFKKSATEDYQTLLETYSNTAPSYHNCQFWFKRFKIGDFDVNDEERPGGPKKFEDNNLHGLSAENSAQTLEELSGNGKDPKGVQLNVARNVKNTLLQLNWEVLAHKANSKNIAASDYHLFKSMGPQAS